VSSALTEEEDVTRIKESDKTQQTIAAFSIMTVLCNFMIVSPNKQCGILKDKQTVGFVSFGQIPLSG
jgi:hypothetical protein